MGFPRKTFFQFVRQLHTFSADAPSDSLKKKIAELEKLKKRKNPKKNQLFVEVPESKSYLDTATMPMILTVVGVALFAKLLMMPGSSHLDFLLVLHGHSVKWAVFIVMATDVVCIIYWQYDESKSQETIERKIRNAPAGQGTVRMLTREEWEEIQELRPRTPFESKLARPNARLRTGEKLHMVKLKPFITVHALYVEFV
ncbi:hypothetical protein RJ639_033295 [Escallonia herrerae]|uniref:Uncharacterized protein n=1 Tax=Escallonia herrerae TaxID=1293975 RepID=A0AA88X8I7_9ASTE|nr:hypothetical protein RJ639_033295 [Escallonia herrerae]